MEILVKFNKYTNILHVNNEDKICKIFELLNMYHYENAIYFYSKSKILEHDKTFSYYNFHNLDSIQINIRINGGRMKQTEITILHKEILDMINELLNKKLLFQSNKVIESTNKNASLIKCYIYSKICQKNYNMDKKEQLLLIKNMDENEIIKIVKKMPNLYKLEEYIEAKLKN